MRTAMANGSVDNDLANVSTNLTALTNARARVSIDAAAMMGMGL